MRHFLYLKKKKENTKQKGNELKKENTKQKGNNRYYSKIRKIETPDFKIKSIDEKKEQIILEDNSLTNNTSKNVDRKEKNGLVGNNLITEVPKGLHETGMKSTGYPLLNETASLGRGTTPAGGTSILKPSTDIFESQTEVLPPTAGVLPPTTGVLPSTIGVLPPKTGVLPPTTGVLPPTTVGVLPPTTVGVLPPTTVGALPPTTSVLPPTIVGTLPPKTGVLLPTIGVLPPTTKILTPTAGILGPTTGNRITSVLTALTTQPTITTPKITVAAEKLFVPTTTQAPLEINNDNEEDTNIKQQTIETETDFCFYRCSCWPVWASSIITFITYLILFAISLWLTARLFHRGFWSSSFYKGGGYWLLGAGVAGLTVGSLIGGLVNFCVASGLTMGGGLMAFSASLVLVGRRGAWLGAIGGVGFGGVIGVMTNTGVLGIALGLSIGFLLGLVLGFLPFARELKINEKYIERGLTSRKRRSLTIAPRKSDDIQAEMNGKNSLSNDENVGAKSLSDQDFKRTTLDPVIKDTQHNDRKERRHSSTQRTYQERNSHDRVSRQEQKKYTEGKK